MEFDIPAGKALASESYRAGHAEKIRRMQSTGQITYEHLPRAIQAAVGSERREKTAEDKLLHTAMMARVMPWKKNQLPPGAQRADGQDADSAREYQRAYRERKKNESTKNPRPTSSEPA